MSGTVTALEVQKRNKERVNVFLDGEYTFSLTIFEAAKLRKGQLLSDDDIAALKAQDDVERALERAIRFLSYRARSVYEIRRNLQQKDVLSATIDDVIARLEYLGYVDDLAFARFWVKNRDDFKPKGPMALRQELKEKGVATSIIEQVLAEVDFTDAAYRAAMQRAKRWQGLEQREFKQKMFPYLARRGFRSETIRDVLALLVEELAIRDKHDNDEF